MNFEGDEISLITPSMAQSSRCVTAVEMVLPPTAHMKALPAPWVTSTDACAKAPCWVFPLSVAFLTHETIGPMLLDHRCPAIPGGHGKPSPMCASTLMYPSCQGTQHDPQVWSRNNHEGILALSRCPLCLLCVESMQGRKRHSWCWVIRVPWEFG